MKRLNTILVASFALVLISAATASADQPSDAWVTTQVKMKLLTDDLVDAFDVNVDTFDGRVTLHGQVANDIEKARAESKAREIAGVRDVRNLLAVVPEAARDATRIADDALSTQISRVLEADRALEGSDVRVKSVNDGIVVLAGDAKSLTAHQRALEDARSVEGVRQVASEIRSPDTLGDEEIWDADEAGDATDAALEEGQRVASDAWITTQAKVRLMAEPGLSPLAINVDTYRGVVTLFGIVKSEDVKTRAEQQVRQVGGVKRLENELQVVPDVAAGSVEAKDEDLTAAVEKRLAERAALSDAEISVAVSNRVVRLTGKVTSQEDRLTALSVARATKGVSSVLDGLRLSEPRG